MDDVQFTDGLDAPDRVAFGLGAWQLLTVAAGAGIAYALLHSPLPLAMALPAAAVAGCLGAGLGWLRVGGRPALEWAVFGARFATQGRAGHLVFDPAASAGAAVVPLRPEAVAVPRDPHSFSVPALRRPLARAGAHRITFFSQRGGAGRTMLATELACVLAAQGERRSRRRLRVALLDMDGGRGAVAARLGLAPGPTLLDFALAHPDRRRVTDFLAPHPSGVGVLLGIPVAAPSVWPLQAHVVREVLRELDLEGFDVVVSDVGAHLSDVTRAVITSADDVFVVLSPTPAGVEDAYRTTETLRRLGLRHQLRYVLNRVHAGADVEEMIGDLRAQIVAEIPEDAAFAGAEVRRLPVSVMGGAAAASLQRFGRRIHRELRAA